MGTLFGVAAIILDIFALTDVMKSNRDTTTKVVLMVLIFVVPHHRRRSLFADLPSKGLLSL